MSDLKRLLDFEPYTATESDVLAYLEEQHAKCTEVQNAMPIEQFWQAGDLALYHQALAWWPTDATNQHNRLFGLGELCSYVLWVKSLTAPHPTFREALHANGERCVKWLQANNRNIQNPNETKDERKRRLGREAQARYRANAKENGSSPRNDHVKQLWSAYMDACRVRKEAIAQIKARHDEDVCRAYAAWEKAKAALSA